MSMPGTSEWIIIIAIVCLLFGAKRLPELGGAVGESIRNFKKGIKDVQRDEAAPRPVKAEAEVEAAPSAEAADVRAPREGGEP